MESPFSKTEIENTRKVLTIKLEEQRKKVEDAEKQAKTEKEKFISWQSMLNELMPPEDITVAVNRKIIRTNPTFKQGVLSILSDGRPRTTRQCYEDFLKTPTDSVIKNFYDFSGRFSNITPKGTIKKHKIETNPIDKRYFYGLAEWFDGDNLRQEYFNKIIL
ncbi:MAG: hypothetical protein WCR01_10640 [Bacteroidota bacterium]